MSRPDAPEMNLPAGKTCSDCVNWERCKRLICSLQPTNDSCDWSPSRFIECPFCEAKSQEITALKAELQWLRAASDKEVKR